MKDCLSLIYKHLKFLVWFSFVICLMKFPQPFWGKYFSNMYRVRLRLEGSGQRFYTDEKLHSSTLLLHRTGVTGRIFEGLVLTFGTCSSGGKLGQLVVLKL